MGDNSTDQRQFPIQSPEVLQGTIIKVPESVYMAAYEVYCHVCSPQKALIDLEAGCRSGFGMNELVSFLYARKFPQEEWRQRVDEAFKGMNF